MRVTCTEMACKGKHDMLQVYKERQLLLSAHQDSDNRQWLVEHGHRHLALQRPEAGSRVHATSHDVGGCLVLTHAGSGVPAET